MSDAYPANFEIEIDREPLTRYLRAQHRTAWVFLMLFVGVCAGLISASKYLETHAALPLTANCWPAGWRCLCYVIGFQLVGLLGYVLSVRTVKTYVDRLLLAVEGPFLRIRKRVGGVERDRKFHFRLLLVYSTKQDARMKKLGISTLVITTSAGAEMNRTIEVSGVKDCLKVRDMLSEIDSQRENT